MANMYLRSHMKQKKKRKNEPEVFEGYEWALVFDTETTTDMFQNLKIGFYKVYYEEELFTQGLFYDEVDNKELDILKAYSKENNIDLLTLENFIDKVFYKIMFDLEGICIGFNLPFDLSRIAKRWGVGRLYNSESFVFTLNNDFNKPNIRITNRDNTCAFMRFSSSKAKKKIKGKFLDTRTLACVFSSEKGLSLKKACEIFNVKGHKISGKHGRITKKYIEYCINDVHITYQLYFELMKRYKEYELSIPPHQIYSNASLGKRLLHELNIKPFQKQNPNFPDMILGKIMSAYYGGRTNCNYRRKPINVSALDFLSMYPTTFTMMELWRFVIAEKITYIDETKETQALLEKITLEDLRKPDAWKDLTILVRIKPEEDLLPIRSKYGEKDNATTIGINYLTSKQEVWCALPDVIGSKLLTGKTPTITKAIKFQAKGTQKQLQKTSVLGLTIDPKEQVIKKLIEKRQEYKQLHQEHRQKALKILANSTSYGIFLETNHTKDEEETQIFSDESFKAKVAFEKTGEWFNPVIAVHQIAGSRLLLAMAEAHLKKQNSNYAYMDTDSVYAPPEKAKALQELFQPLQPYNFKADFLKLEKENVLFYGISSKRYCLYQKEDENIRIVEYKLHGLGHIANPLGDESDWHESIWRDILMLEYKQKKVTEIQEKYQNLYVLTKRTVTKPIIMKRFKTINRQIKEKNRQIKPFNFFYAGQATITERKKEVKPILSLIKNPQSAPYEKFIDYTTGKELQGEEYWEKMDALFFKYIEHPESKYQNGKEKGLLIRRHLQDPKIKHIGKETKNIEEGLENAENKLLNTYNPSISRQNAYYHRKKLTSQTL